MIKTLKEFRVFMQEGVPTVKPVRRHERDRGQSLSSVFSIIPVPAVASQQVGGYLSLKDAYSSLRRKQIALELLAAVALLSPYLWGYTVSNEMPFCFLFMSVAGALVLMERLLNLPGQQISDCQGNVADLKMRTIRLSDGTIINLKGGEDADAG